MLALYTIAYERGHGLTVIIDQETQAEVEVVKASIESKIAQRIPSLDLRRNYARIEKEIKEAIDGVLASQAFILGPEVEAFEEEAAMYLEMPHAVGCSSGSDALLLALMALGVGEGDEVITTPYSFFATASCIARLGARPVFVDVDPRTYNVDVEEALERVSPRTKAFIPVHLFGQMAPLEAAIPRLRERGVALVEDAAQAFGSWRRSGGEYFRAGAAGDFGCFSFYPTKNLSCYGDGGMVTCKKSDAASRLRRLRFHGADHAYLHEEMGLNSRLDSIQAAVLRVKLRHLEEWNEERRLVADRYGMLLAEKGLLEVVRPPEVLEGNYHIFHQYTVRVSGRNELQRFLAERDIETKIYYPLPLHLQPCFKYLGYGEGDFPEAEALSKDSLALPIFPELTVDEQERVVDAIAAFYALKRQKG